jgi:hypothetical protein
VILDQHGLKSRCHQDISGSVADRDSTELSKLGHSMPKPKFRKGDKVILNQSRSENPKHFLKVHTQKETKQFDQEIRYNSWIYQLEDGDGALYKEGNWVSETDLELCDAHEISTRGDRQQIRLSLSKYWLCCGCNFKAGDFLCFHCANCSHKRCLDCRNPNI